MRDLSKVPLGRSHRTVKRAGYFRVLILLAIVLGVIFLFKSRLSYGPIAGSSVVLKEASRGLTPVSLDGDHEELTENAVNLTTQTAALEDVKYGGEATAKATRSFGGGSFSISVDATLPDPVNTNYQVWLVGGGEVIPIDFMRGEGTEWSLSVRTEDYSNYNEVWITLERTKDEFPEEHVMEGSF
jgi:hypothetical protein